MATRATARFGLTVGGPQREIAVGVPTHAPRLFGVLSKPPGGGRTGVLLLAGGGPPCMYHGRTWVHVARRLAQRGLAVLRFDYRGVGESHGLAGTLRLAEPFTKDAIEAAELLLRLGIDRLLVVGTCFGGHIAISALGSLPVAGCMLIDLPFCDGYLGKPLQRSHPLLGAVDALERALANGTRIELLYGKPDETLDTTHDAPVADRLCLLGERYAPQFRIEVVEPSLHGLMTLDVQALVADHVVEFCSALAPRA